MKTENNNEPGKSTAQQTNTSVQEKANPAPKEKKPLVSGPGQFTYEFNKLMFFTNVASILKEFDMDVPEDLLNNDEFQRDILEFLKKHKISFPTQNIPKYDFNTESKVRVFPVPKSKSSIIKKADDASDELKSDKKVKEIAEGN